MAKIYNTDCTKALAQNAAIQQNVDKVPNELAEKIVPTFETNPQVLREVNVMQYGQAVVSGPTTIYTTPSTGQDFYLTYLDFGMIKDAACNAATGRINVTANFPGMGSKQLCSIPIITLTAQETHITVTFPHPIKLDKGTQIQMTGTYAAGVMSRTLNIAGFLVYNINN